MNGLSPASFNELNTVIKNGLGVVSDQMELVFFITTYTIYLPLNFAAG